MKIFKNRFLALLFLVIFTVFAIISVSAMPVDPSGGALSGNRYRIIVSTDIGGNDPDDYQSMVHLFVYADLFDIEGLISSPPYAGRKQHILDTIAKYELDYNNLKTYSSNYPTPTALINCTKQGAIDPAPSAGYSSATEGSSWIINRAKVSDSRPLYILVWGSITDVAQAVHDDPTIKSKIRVISIGSWNTDQDVSARNYLYNSHSDLWWVESDTTFRGMYLGGIQTGDLGNDTFVSNHVRYHGNLGDWFYAKKTTIKMGDTPTVLYLLKGDPGSPTTEHWGGMYKPITSHGAAFWEDLTDSAYFEGSYAGAKTVDKWRENYLRNWQYRMDRCNTPQTSTSTPTPTPTPGATATPTPTPSSLNPIGWWKLDETTGTTASDSSGNALNGTLSNGPVWTAGKLNNCLGFDGTNDYVNIGNPTQLQLTGAMTVTAWIYLDTVINSGRIITKGGPSGARGWELDVDVTASKAEFLVATNSTTLIICQSATAIPTGQWVHLAGVYEPGVATRIYVNKALSNSNTTSIPASQYNSANNVNIGRRAANTNYFDGKIDDVRIYNVALTGSQIAALP